MQQAPSYLETLAKVDPKMLEHVTGVREYVIADRALSAKVKTLMTMLCDALLAHEDGVYIISQRARALGASEEEIAETVQVAYLMGGTPALVTGCNAFRD